MIRSENLINKLVADLHFHNYMEITGDDIMSNNHNVVITNSKKQVILDYIDDVFIDYFFRTHSFKPIIIPKGFVEKRYTEQGLVRVNSDISLCLNNIYDRYTFVSFVFQNFCSSSSRLHQQFPQNTFLQNLFADENMHGAASQSSEIKTSHFMAFEYNQFLDSDSYKMAQTDDWYLQKEFDCQASVPVLIKFNKYRYENFYKFNFEGFTNIGIQVISDIRRDYIKLKDSHLFGDYTIEEILLIYSLLVEKFKFKEDDILTFIPMFVDIEALDNSILGEFNQFERSNTDYKIIEPYIFMKDLYLRFTSPTRTKAFTFKIIDDMFIEIQHFNETPIKSVFFNNPLPLPYLYNQLYNK